MRSREYKALRKAGVLCCRAYRARVCECDRILLVGVDLHSAAHWLWSRDDWQRRLRNEQVLLRALRCSVDRWRSSVLALRPRGTERLLDDLLAGP